MANAREFPKGDGDLAYSADINMAWYDGVVGATTLNFGNTTLAGTTSATIIKAANSSRKTMLIYNNSGTACYIGTTSVTTNGGYPLEQDETLYIKSDTGAIYGASAGSVDIRYWEVE